MAEFVSTEQIFCLTDHYGSRPYGWIVTALGRNEQNTSEYYVFDLGVDPETLHGLSPEELIERLQRPPKPVRRLRANAAPVMMPTEDAPTFASGRDLSIEELRRRADLLRADTDLRSGLIAAFEAGRIRPAATHVEQQIYDGFLTSDDQRLIEAFHAAPWEGRMSIVGRLSDRRMKQLGRRLIFAERPDLFPDDMWRKLDRMRAQRVLGSDGPVPWRTIEQALFDIEGMMSEAQPDAVEFLVGHKNYLLDCRERSNRLLGGASGN